ncbi:hypothetical protein jhhlp_001151 [Lomentospora prolificans]|uniref:Small ribosomal subunit protein uS10m n=1 Tax=Lomentospora prolificans TaxID=41688 RepID=A0A2N3NHG9_9PEZI|nr:hypothetical protein jhhlp_001151 [Lomentospora prolificans]
MSLRSLGRSFAHVKSPPFYLISTGQKAWSRAEAPRFHASLSRNAAEAPNTAPKDAAHENERHLRYPRSVQALYLRPLRREARYGVPSCDLQLRSYSVRSLEFYADFALRAAYYLKLPAFGPVPLPRITERWTVPRSSFIFKKSQENFERITMRRLIQIRDGNPETVQIWLAFLQKHAYAGVGMKANLWEFGKLAPDGDLEANASQELEERWSHFGLDRSLGTPDAIEELLRSRRFKTMGS